MSATATLGGPNRSRSLLAGEVVYLSIAREPVGITLGVNSNGKVSAGRNDHSKVDASTALHEVLPCDRTALATHGTVVFSYPTGQPNLSEARWFNAPLTVEIEVEDGDDDACSADKLTS